MGYAQSHFCFQVLQSLNRKPPLIVPHEQDNHFIKLPFSTEATPFGAVGRVWIFDFIKEARGD